MLGLVLSIGFSFSVQLVERLLNSSMPGLLRLGFPLSYLYFRLLEFPTESVLRGEPYLWRTSTTLAPRS